MTVYITQRFVCDICTKDVRILDQRVTGGAVPQVIQAGDVVNHQGTLLDVCGTCMPILMKAAASLRLAIIANPTKENHNA